MPVDLLRYVSGPPHYSAWWLWLAAAVTIALIGWLTTVFVWTMPSARLRELPVARTLHARLLRRRFARSVHDITDRYRAGEVSGADACGAISRTLRSFLQQATGARAQYMHVRDIAAGELAPAAPLFTSLADAQFRTHADVDVAQLGDTAEELILAWT